MVELTPKLSRWMFCFVGVLPLKLELDEESGRLKSFAFSALHPELWWYLFVLILQMGSSIVMGPKVWDAIYGGLAASGETISVSFFVTALAFVPIVIQHLLEATILFKIKHLNSFWKLIEKCDRQSAAIPQKSSDIKQLILIGIVIAITMISINITMITLNYEKMKEKFFQSENTAFHTVLLLVNAFAVLAYMGRVFLFYISYNAIAFRIKQLSIYLQTDEDLIHSHEVPNQGNHINNCDKTMLPTSNSLNQSVQKTSEMLEKLKMVHLLFDGLVQASQKLNSIFSTYILLYLITISIIITMNLFFFIANISEISLLAPSSILLFAGFSIVTLAAVDLPVREVKNLREVVLQLSVHSENTNQRLEILSFEIALKEDRVRVSAAGLFNVGIDIIPSIIGSMATYLIILLQTLPENSDDALLTNSRGSCEVK